jgi:hypothetical protein
MRDHNVFISNKLNIFTLAESTRVILYYRLIIKQFRSRKNHSKKIQIFERTLLGISRIFNIFE